MNLAIVQRSYAAFDRGDLDGGARDMDDAIEWQQAQGLPHGGIYHGTAAVRANIFDPLDRDWWSEFSAVPDEFLDAGDEVVVLGRYRGIAKQTGKALDVPFVHVWSLRDGKGVALPPVPRHRRVGRGALRRPVRSAPAVDMSPTRCFTHPTHFVARAGLRHNKAQWLNVTTRAHHQGGTSE